MPSRKRPSKRKSKRQGVSRKKCKTCSRSRKVVRRRSSTNLRGGANIVNVPAYMRIFEYTHNHEPVLKKLQELQNVSLTLQDLIMDVIVKQIIDYYRITKNNSSTDTNYDFSKVTVGLCKALNGFRDCYYINKIKTLHGEILSLATVNTDDPNYLINMFKALQIYKMIATYKSGIHNIVDEDEDLEDDISTLPIETAQQTINTAIMHITAKKFRIQKIQAQFNIADSNINKIQLGEVQANDDTKQRLNQERHQLQQQITTLQAEVEVFNKASVNAYTAVEARTIIDTYVTTTLIKEKCDATATFIQQYDFKDFAQVTELTISAVMVEFFVRVQTLT